MRLQELGQAIRGARHAHGQTQAQLAKAAGISRETLNLLESGLVRDLGIRKVLAVLEALGLAIAVDSAARPRKPDYLRMACTSASTSFRAALTERELAHALITGKVGLDGVKDAFAELANPERHTKILVEPWR